MTSGGGVPPPAGGNRVELSLDPQPPSVPNNASTQPALQSAFCNRLIGTASMPGVATGSQGTSGSGVVLGSVAVGRTRLQLEGNIVVAMRALSNWRYAYHLRACCLS
jgi:hypothetical protein